MRTGRGKARYRPSRATRSRKARPRQEPSAAESALRETEQRFYDLFHAASIWSWEIDAEAIVTYVSHNYEAQLGIPSSALIGRRFDNVPGTIVAPEERQRVLEFFQQRRGWRDFLYSRKLPNGKTLWIKTSAVPMFDEKGAFRGYRGVVMDITERMRAEAFAQLAQRRLHDAVSYVRQPFVVDDAQDRVVSFNHAFALLHSAPGEETAVRQGVSFRKLAQWQVLSDFYAAGGEPVDSETLVARYQNGGEHTYISRTSAGCWWGIATCPMAARSASGPMSRG